MGSENIDVVKQVETVLTLCAQNKCSTQIAKKELQQAYNKQKEYGLNMNVFKKML